MAEFLSGNRHIAYPLARRPGCENESAVTGFLLDASAAFSGDATDIVIRSIGSDSGEAYVVVDAVIGDSTVASVHVPVVPSRGRYSNLFAATDDMCVMLVVATDMIDEIVRMSPVAVNTPLASRCVNLMYPMLESLEPVSNDAAAGGSGVTPGFRGGVNGLTAVTLP